MGIRIVLGKVRSVTLGKLVATRFLSNSAADWIGESSGTQIAKRQRPTQVSSVFRVRVGFLDQIAAGDPHVDRALGAQRRDVIGPQKDQDRSAIR